MIKLFLSFIVVTSSITYPIISYAQTTSPCAAPYNALVQIVDTPYNLQAESKFGAVWVVISGEVINKNGKIFSKGQYSVVKSGEDILLTSNKGMGSKLVVVSIQKEDQPLTITPLTIAPFKTIADASDRNTTLLIALNKTSVTDTISAGGEEDWHETKPEKISLSPGQTRWIIPGIHTFKNIKNTRSDLITIEW